MAKIEFNSTWWMKNCAKTLVGSGMEPALKAWEAKKKGSAEAVCVALENLSKAAAVAEKKANKTLHKETIVYLQAYQKQCDIFIKKLEKADGSSLSDPDKVLTPPILKEIGANQKGKMYVGELKYLFVTKGKPGAASKAIYDAFISDAAANQVNISAVAREKCDKLATAGTWVDAGWEMARDEVFKMAFLTTNFAALKSQVLAPMEAEPILNEIRSL